MEFVVDSGNKILPFPQRPAPHSPFLDILDKEVLERHFRLSSPKKGLIEIRVVGSDNEPTFDDAIASLEEMETFLAERGAIVSREKAYHVFGKQHGDRLVKIVVSNEDLRLGMKHLGE